MARPLIALLTDFGTRDHYVGVMKAVVLGICPEATLVDITHEVPAHDILSGAVELAAAYAYFPAGTVFLAVIDPGVGSSRRGLAVETAAFRFVAPDNGVLSMVLRESPPTRIVELTGERYSRPSISRTFEGRDRFAPAAAWLASGIDLLALGPPVDTYVTQTVPEPETDREGMRGTVVRVDRFGNLITNIGRRLFETLPIDRVRITVDGHAIDRIVLTYSEAPPGELCALLSSSGHLEIAANGASAADRLGAARGSDVRVSILGAHAEL